MAGDALLEAVALSKHFGGLRAVDGMDLRVRAGTVTGIIGPNGAGKSTLFDLLAGAEAPTAGKVLLDGRDVTRFPAHVRARLGVARTFQLTRALARMTVRENCLLSPKGQTGERMLGALFAGPRVAREEAEIGAKVDEVLRTCRLDAHADAYAGALSGGQKKLLELARALMTDPRLILLDEPMAGVNPTLARELMDLVERLRRERGITFVLIEHDLETVFGRCDPIVVMANGKLLAEGDAAAVRANADVIEAYLGG